MPVDDVVYMAKQTIIAKPNLERWLFWDTNYDTIDWQKAYRTIIEGIIERGNVADWEEIVRYYGRDKVISTLRDETAHLQDDAIEAVCAYFPIKKEEMRCYIRKLSRMAR